MNSALNLFVFLASIGMFKNMRRRGAQMCDVAVVVIDLMHGLEKQTHEVLSHLMRRKVRIIDLACLCFPSGY